MGKVIVYQLICFFVCATLFLPAQVDAGDRSIGMHITAPENEDFFAATNTSMEACASVTHLFTPWSSLENVAGEFNGESVGYLDVADQYYPAFGLQVELNIAVTNTVTREIPEQLQTLEWDDPEMIDHFKVLLDSVFSHIPHVNLNALLIGNESDILMGVDAEEITHFKNFLAEVKLHAKELYFDLHGTDLLVGTTLTYAGLTSPISSAFYHDLNSVLDVISVTYYHIGPDFYVLPVETVGANWQILTELYSDMDKPIHFVECGCPSSALLNGSEVHQADFISAVFDAWDDQLSRVKVVNFFMLHDWSQSFVDELAVYYGLEGNVEFKEYLRTLGLRTFPGAGTDKLALERLRCEADARNFCDAECVVGVNEIQHQLATLYPNPAIDWTNIDCQERCILSIYQMDNHLVHSQSLKQGINRLSLQLTSGVYMLLLQSDTDVEKKILLVP